MTQQVVAKTPDWPNIWMKARERLRRELGDPVFTAWIGKLSLLDSSNNEIRLGAPRPFVRNWVANNYLSRIEKALRAEGGEPASVTVVLCEAEAPRVAAPAEKEQLVTPARQEASLSYLPTQSSVTARAGEKGRGLSIRVLDPTQTFESFVAGPANAIALRAAQSFAHDEAEDVALLFVHGSFGFGKTHLLNATALEARRRGRRALLLSAEDFMRQFLGALNRKETLGFKEELRAADMLLIDDLQHLCRSTYTISEFLHTLNAYADLRRKLVIAADRAPAALEGLGPDVRSRLSGGIVTALERPDRATRLGILKAKAEEYARKRAQTIIPDEALGRIADLEDATPRDLMGFFNNLALHAELAKTPVAITAAAESIVRRGAVVKKTSIEDIQRKIADFYKLELRDFQSSQRSRRVARPRQVAMFLAREITARSLPEIGRRFGGRDHTTVLHACRRIAALCNEDPAFKQEVDFLKQVLDKGN
ncbi:MAG TPA: chromosomal replication initiator protein DnaA [Rhizomicrobium sp.]|jgi:chromosomal replication initiator protein